MSSFKSANPAENPGISFGSFSAPGVVVPYFDGQVAVAQTISAFVTVQLLPGRTEWSDLAYAAAPVGAYLRDIFGGLAQIPVKIVIHDKQVPVGFGRTAATLAALAFALDDGESDLATFDPLAPASMCGGATIVRFQLKEDSSDDSSEESGAAFVADFAQMLSREQLQWVLVSVASSWLRFVDTETDEPEKTEADFLPELLLEALEAKQPQQPPRLRQLQQGLAGGDADAVGSNFVNAMQPEVIKARPIMRDVQQSLLSETVQFYSRRRDAQQNQIEVAPQTGSTLAQRPSQSNPYRSLRAPAYGVVNWTGPGLLYLFSDGNKEDAVDFITDAATFGNVSQVRMVHSVRTGAHVTVAD